MNPDVRPPISDLRCRLIIDEPASGSWNMAVDEALLDAAIDGGPATLRLYQWEEPTLSLGYFQRHDDRRAHASSGDCAVVRRSSGGGAILHDRELTYSLALPAGHPLARDAGQLYAAVHRVFVELLTSQLPTPNERWLLRVVPAGATSAAGPGRRADAEPFLCFQRRSPGDVLLVAESGVGESTPDGHNRPQNWKIVGSAQRRRGGAILQHGSVLLERSSAAPELPGWRDLTDAPAAFSMLSDGFPQLFSAELGITAAPASLPASTCDAARRIERAKYADWAWTTRR